MDPSKILDAILAHGASCDANSVIGLVPRVAPGEYVSAFVDAIRADGFAVVPSFHHRDEAWVVAKVQDLGALADAGELVEKGSLTEVWAACLALDASDGLLGMLLERAA